MKSVFNKVERRQPWTDNTSKMWQVVKEVVKANNYNPIKIFKTIRYLVTREGASMKPGAAAKAQARLHKDIVRYVREKGLVKKLNQLRPTEDQLTEAQVKDHVFGVGLEGSLFLPKPKLFVSLRVVPEFGAIDRTQGWTFLVSLAYEAKSLVSWRAGGRPISGR